MNDTIRYGMVTMAFYFILIFFVNSYRKYMTSRYIIKWSINKKVIEFMEGVTK